MFEIVKKSKKSMPNLDKDESLVGSNQQNIVILSYSGLFSEMLYSKVYGKNFFEGIAYTV